MAISELVGTGWLSQSYANGLEALMIVGFEFRSSLGILVIWRRDPREWTPDQVHVARSLADLIGHALARCDSDERFGQAFSQGPFGFGMVSWNGELLDSNPRFREYFGEGAGGGSGKNGGKAGYAVTCEVITNLVAED